MSNQQYFYARVKPYNLRRNHLCVRVHVLGRVWLGGDGLTPQTIPEWVKVNAAQALELQKFKQVDSDVFSPGIFDIVTAAQRKAIDVREEGLRKAFYGIGVASTSDNLPDLTAAVLDGTKAPEEKTRVTMEDLADQEADSDAVLLNNDVGGLSNDLVDKRRRARALDDVSGRMAAASGLGSDDDDGDEDGLPDTEDLNAPADPPPAKKPRRKRAQKK